MSEIIKEIQLRISELEKQISELQNVAAEPVPGRLRLSHSKQIPMYYQRTVYGNRYLKKSERGIASLLAAQDYREDLLKLISGELAVLRRFQKSYVEADAVKLYLSYHADRRKLFLPTVLPDDMFVEEWRQKLELRRQLGSISYEPPSTFKTDSGDYVRSKSELILANLFTKFNIPYFYELPLQLDRTLIYPDFTLLSVKKRKTYYWEHEGMLSDTAYGSQVVKKHCLYEKNGIYENLSLLISRETNECPLDITLVENKIRKFLL